MNSKQLTEITVAHRRAEELLLELLIERLGQHKPNDKEWEASQQDAAGIGRPYTKEQLAHHKGYDLGWRDCYEQMCNIIADHNEGNAPRV